ncbi:hypothetical protein BGZ74_011468 [Mortierella antarctica]|nr:hypothetical protein BGZ74_011468 [Mortierella antarctica]
MASSNVQLGSPFNFITLKFLALAAMALLALVSSTASAEHCIDNGTGSTDPTIAAPKRQGNLYVKLNHATKLSSKYWFCQTDPSIEI